MKKTRDPAAVNSLMLRRSIQRWAPLFLLSVAVLEPQAVRPRTIASANSIAISFFILFSSYSGVAGCSGRFWKRFQCFHALIIAHREIKCNAFLYTNSIFYGITNLLFSDLCIFSPPLPQENGNVPQKTLDKRENPSIIVVNCIQALSRAVEGTAR